MPYFLPDLDSADVEAASPLDEARAWERPFFLFVGRLEEIKGLQDVIPHFGPDAPADLVVIGAGDYEARLQKLARASPRVHFLGRLAPEAIRPFYRDAIATIVPSLCYETFGIVVLESFREATPVIARRLGPLPEVIEPVGGGLTFETGDELGVALRQLTEDPRLGEAMGAAGHEGLRARWLESCVLKQYFGIIRRAAKQRKHERALTRLASTEAS
jgi:glycosyltransferase involved in cell wall biosynthesis